MGISVLGPLTVDGAADGLARRARVVLAVLVVRHGGVVSADELADALWADRPPASWAKVVQGCVVRLRQVLGGGAIATVPGGYRLAIDGDGIDSVRFVTQVDRARSLLAHGDAGRARHVVADALSLWQGSPLTDLEDWEPGRIEAHRLVELRETAEELHIDALLASGAPEAAVPAARRIVEADPLRERRWILLATAQYQAGSPGAALDSLRQLRSECRKQGLDPGPDVPALEEAILRHDVSVRRAPREPRTVWARPALPSRWNADAPVFVGRARERETLRRAFADLTHSSRQAVFVGGEAGAGKSRVALEACREFYAEGAAVLLGQSSSGLDRPYHPFMRPLTTLWDAASTGELALPDQAADVVVDRLRVLVGSGPLRPASEGEGGEAPHQAVQLYDAAALLMTAAAEERPVVIVLEDLHWAGAATLDLLVHLVEATADSRVMFLVTHRSTTPDRSRPLLDAVARLLRLEGVQRLDVEPLRTEDIADYLVHELGTPSHEARSEASRLRDLTGGNAFYLREVVRHEIAHPVNAGTAGPRTPATIRDVLGSRLHRVDERVRAVLEIAAVMGHDFESAVLAAASDAPGDVVLEAVDCGRDLGLIEPLADAPGQFGFAHDLARQSVIELLSGTALASAHRAIAMAIESEFPSVQHRVERLAHHYSAAADLGTAPQAITYLTLAGEAAAKRLAHAEAAGLFMRAAALAVDPLEQGDLTMRAAHAHQEAGSFEQAMDLAREVAGTSDARLRLQAAIAFESAAWRHGNTGSEAAALLRSALTDLGSADELDPKRVRGMGSLARALEYAGHHDDRRELSSSAIELARRSGDTGLLVHALETAVVGAPWPQWARANLELTRELAEVARQTGAREAEFHGLSMGTSFAYVIGDIESVTRNRELEQEAARLSGSELSSYVVLSHRFAHLFAQGELHEALATTRVFLGRGREVGRDLSGASSVQEFLTRRELDQLGPVRGLVSGTEDPASR